MNERPVDLTRSRACIPAIAEKRPWGGRKKIALPALTLMVVLSLEMIDRHVIDLRTDCRRDDLNRDCRNFQNHEMLAEDRV